MFENFHEFPIWYQGTNGWGIDWRIPESFKSYYSNLYHSQFVQKRIIDQAQVYIDKVSGCDWATISFRENWLMIVVDGDRTSYHVKLSDNLGGQTHNIDSADECLTIYNLLLLIIYNWISAIDIWNESPDCQVDKDYIPEEYYRINKKIDFKSDKLFDLKVCDDPTPISFVVARTYQEAESFVDKQIESGVCQVSSHFKILGEVFQQFKKFTYRLFLVDGSASLTKNVIARDLGEANQLLETYLDYFNKISLFKVDEKRICLIAQEYLTPLIL